MDAKYKALLEKQQYEFCGDHSAVKICSWTKQSLRGNGTCYKEKFYGIRAHRCLQMAPSVNFCGLDCIFCWRARHDEPYTSIDDPKVVVQASIKAQQHQLIGFKGNDKVSEKMIQDAMNPRHVAISLTGEPLTYPKVSELIQEYHNEGFTTFLVTNGQHPKVMRKMTLPTQLYVSLDAPNKDLLTQIDKAKNPDQAWENLLGSLDALKELKGKTRTTIRVTLIKGLNDVQPEEYAKLFERADADFIEVKAFMFIGSSRDRLEFENMPSSNEVKEFAEEICKHGNYKYIDEQFESRVVLLAKEDRPDRIMKFKD